MGTSVTSLQCVAMQCFLVILSLLYSASCSAEEINLFIGAYGDIIHQYSLNTHNGTLSKREQYSVGPNPSYLEWRGERLYVANEAENYPVEGSGGAGVFLVTSSGQLGEGSTRSSAGNGPCHITVQPESKSVFVSNYGSGDFSAFWMDNESSDIVIGDLKYSENFGSNSHAHGAFWGRDLRFLYVTDLGGDTVFHYTVGDDGSITKAGSTSTPAGTGPRHMVFHPTLDVAYVVLELGSAVIGYNIDKETGDLDEFGTYPTIPADFTETNYPGGIVMRADGNFLYVTNRGMNSIATFSISSSGDLSLESNVSCEGDWPRAITIDPTDHYILVSNQNSGSVEVFRFENNEPMHSSGVKITTPSIVAFQNK